MLVNPDFFKIKPWDHQLATIKKAIDKDYYALFYEMGCGKTATAINIARSKYHQHKRILKTLILSPVIVKENWRREYDMHSHVGKLVEVLDGPSAKRIDLLKRADKTGKFIFVTNHESLSMKNLTQAIMDHNFEMIIVDESHRFKNPQAKRTKALIKLSDQKELKYKFILTGTPILNTPMDIWSQYRVMDKEIFGDNFFVFRLTYFRDANSGMPAHVHFPNWIAKPGMEEKLNKIIYQHADRVTKDEVLDLPDIVYETIGVELTGEQKRLYNSMKKDFIAFLNDTACVAELAVTKGLRLQQIVSGIFKDDKGVVSLLESNRTKALKELIQDIPPDEKIIVWCVFRNSYDQIARALDEIDEEYVRITGDETYKQKIENVDAFNQDDGPRICIANQAAAGTGINLTRASYSIYFSRNYNLEHDLQSEARNHRGGQTRKVTRIDMVAYDTIDEIILKALKSKLDMSELILEFKKM